MSTETRPTVCDADEVEKETASDVGDDEPQAPSEPINVIVPVRLYGPASDSTTEGSPLMALVVGSETRVGIHWQTWKAAAAAVATATGGASAVATTAALDTLLRSLKVVHVRWEMQRSSADTSATTPVAELSTSAWIPVPEHAKPFPWDGCALTPVPDLLGRVVRAVATFGDASTGEAVPGLRSSISPGLRVVLPPTLLTMCRRVASKRQFGFHASTDERDARGVIVLASLREDDKGAPRAVMQVEVRLVESVPSEGDAATAKNVVSDSMPVFAVGLVDLTLPVADAPCCAMPAPSDEVSVRMYWGERHGCGAAASKNETEPLVSCSVCVRTRKDRDMALCLLRALQATGTMGATSPLLEAVREALASETS